MDLGDVFFGAHVAEHAVLVAADLVDEIEDDVAGESVEAEDTGEDFDGGFEIFGDDLVGTEFSEFGDFGDVAGTDDDVESGLHPACELGGTADGGGVGDGDDEHAGVVDAEVFEDGFAGAVAVVERFVLPAALADGFGVHFEDGVRDIDLAQDAGEAASGEAVADDDDVVTEFAVFGCEFVFLAIAGESSEPGLLIDAEGDFRCEGHEEG